MELKMRKLRQTGFVLVIVIVIISIVAVYTSILTANLNIILSQTNRAYYNACSRNLTVSGLAWSKHNIKSKANLDKAVDLDITEMGIRGSSLAVLVDSPRDEKSNVYLTHSATCGRQIISQTKTHQLKPQ